MLATDQDLDTARRVLVHGVTGSGKSTLARILADARGVPLIEGDLIGWTPGWVHRDAAEQRALVAPVVAQDAWVADSAWGAWSDLVLDRADLVLALDLPRLVSLRRLARRTARRLVTREEICNGNRETFRMLLSRESIILWHFRSFARKRATARGWAADPAMPPVALLRTPDEVDAAARRLGDRAVR